jgi:hypothetical protein
MTIREAWGAKYIFLNGMPCRPLPNSRSIGVQIDKPFIPLQPSGIMDSPQDIQEMKLMSIPDLSPPPDTGPDAQSAEQQEVRRRMLLLRRAKGGINWFYWVAGLTIINTIIFVTGRIPNYFLGLGVAQLVDGYTVAVANGTEIAPLMHWVAAAMDLLLSSIFLLFGYRGQRSYRSWIVAGIVLYTLDGMVFLLLGVWLGVAFHAFVIYSLVRGLRAMDELNRIGPPGPPREPASSDPA